jgi:Ca2+-binding EF-hand superfamily protein
MQISLQRTVAAALLVTVLHWPGHLYGEDPPGDKEEDIEKINVARHFSELDQNKDGLLTREEAEIHQQLSAAFGCFDADDDGHIDLDEFQAFNAANDNR